MKKSDIVFFLLLLLASREAFSEQTNSTDTNYTEEALKPSQKDLLIAKLKILETEIALNNKKIQVLEQVRSYSATRNQTDSPLDLGLLREGLSGHQTSQQSRQIPSKTSANIPSRPSNEAQRGRTDPQNLMNKIMKKFTFDLPQAIKEMSFVPIKPIQKSADEPPVASLLVFLTQSNNILLYEINGNFLTAFEPNHQVKGFAVNQLTDENFIVTLGTDNTIRMHTLNISRINLDEDIQEAKPKKNDKAKYVLSALIRLEYIYDLENNQIISEGICEKICPERTEQNYGSLSAVHVRQLKQLALHAEDGGLLLINRNGTYRGKYDFSGENFLNLQKFHPNPIFATDKSVGLFNVAAMDIAKPHCDLPGAKVIKVEPDQYSSNYFYALLATGEVLIYETKADGGCRILTKKPIAGYAQGVEPTNIHSSRNFVLIQKDIKGTEITAYNVTDVVISAAIHFDQYEISLYPAKSDIEKVAKSKYITQRSGFASNLIGSYFEYNNGSAIFSIHEITIMNKSSADWLDDFRMPIIIGAILIVIGYQFLFKKKSPPGRGGHRHHNHGPGEECNDDIPSRARPSRPVAREPAGVTRRNVGNEPNERFRPEDFDDLRREYEGLRKAKEAIKEKKRVTFEDTQDDNDNDGGEYEEEYERLFKKKI